MIGEETLRLSQRLEPAHDLLPFSGRPVRNFNAVVETLMCTMIGIRRHRPDRNPIAAQLVGDQNPRLAVLLDETPEEALRSPCIAALLDKNVEHIAIGIYGSPQPVHFAVDLDNDFIQVPFCPVAPVGRDGCKRQNDRRND